MSTINRDTTATIDGITHRLHIHTDHGHARKLAGYCHICNWRMDNASAAKLRAGFDNAHNGQV